ncbi:MAG: hypothetical protein JWM04_2262 [Verrucomicrobiales bacterium]|nr:hypothetical protein [Verrucomicrobiales bacterium]
MPVTDGQLIPRTESTVNLFPATNDGAEVTASGTVMALKANPVTTFAQTLAVATAVKLMDLVSITGTNIQPLTANSTPEEKEATAILTDKRQSKPTSGDNPETPNPFIPSVIPNPLIVAPSIQVTVKDSVHEHCGSMNGVEQSAAPTLKELKVTPAIEQPSVEVLNGKEEPKEGRKQSRSQLAPPKTENPSRAALFEKTTGEVRDLPGKTILFSADVKKPSLPPLLKVISNAMIGNNQGERTVSLDNIPKPEFACDTTSLGMVPPSGAGEEYKGIQQIHPLLPELTAKENSSSIAYSKHGKQPQTPVRPDLVSLVSTKALIIPTATMKLGETAKPAEINSEIQLTNSLPEWNRSEQTVARVIRVDSIQSDSKPEVSKEKVLTDRTDLSLNLEDFLPSPTVIEGTKNEKISIPSQSIKALTPILVEPSLKLQEAESAGKSGPAHLPSEGANTKNMVLHDGKSVNSDNSESLSADPATQEELSQPPMSVRPPALKAKDTGINRKLVERFILEHGDERTEEAPAIMFGTSAAKEGFEMKKPAHLNKIAASGKQQFPAEVTEQMSKVESFSNPLLAGKETPSSNFIHSDLPIGAEKAVFGNDFQPDMPVSPKIHQLVENLFEKISNESQLLKTKDASTVSFRIQPDDKSELVIQINREGHTFKVSVGCDDASNAKMSSSWGELQQRLQLSAISVEPLKSLPQSLVTSELQSNFDPNQQRKGRNPFEQLIYEPEMHWAGAMVESPRSKYRITKTMSRNNTGWEGVA